MAALGEMNVKIGADIKELISKVDQAKAKLNQLTESEQQLKASVNDLNSSLKQNEAELGKAASALRKLVDSGKGATLEAKKLRNEISGLATNSATLTTKLSATKTQLAATTVQLKAQAVAAKQAEVATGGIGKGATKAFSALRTLANIIPGIGIGGLVGLIAGPLVEAFQDWFDATSKVSEATQLLKARQGDLNDIMKDAGKDAGKQITDLKILYEAATNVNLSLNDRLAAVKGLQNEFPSFFGNIKTETILNGGAKDAYDALSKSIQDTARAKAALAKLGDIEAEQLENDFRRKKILIATENELAAARKRGDIVIKGASGAADITHTVETEIKIIEKRRQAALKDIETNDKILAGRRDFVTKFIGISELAAAVETSIKPVKIKIDKPPKSETKKVAKVVKEDIEEALTQEFALARIPIPIENIFKTSKQKIDPNIEIFPTDQILRANAALDELQTKLDKTADFAQGILSPVFDELFTSIADGSKSAFQAFGDALKGLLRQLIVTVAKAAALAAIMTIFFPGSALGKQGFDALFKKFAGFAEGGPVRGRGSKTSDSIPARLSAGEYVMKASAVDKFGVKFFDMLNNGKGMNFFGGIPKYAAGGFVTPSLGSIGGGQAIQLVGEFELRNDRLVAAIRRGNAQINRNG